MTIENIIHKVHEETKRPKIDLELISKNANLLLKFGDIGHYHTALNKYSSYVEEAKNKYQQGGQYEDVQRVANFKLKNLYNILENNYKVE